MMEINSIGKIMKEKESLRLEYCEKCQHGFYIKQEHLSFIKKLQRLLKKDEKKISCQKCPKCGSNKQVILSRIVTKVKNG